MYNFKVNDYISLSCKADKTVVLVDNHEFIQCKSILVNIPAECSYRFEDINSIDHIVDFFK